MTVRNGTITLPPPATAAAREAAREPARLLWHTCTVHRRILDGPCGPGCRMLCGVRWRVGAEERCGLGISPDHCVVCEDLGGQP